MLAGTTALLVTAGGEALIIRREIKRHESTALTEGGADEGNAEEEEEDVSSITELSSVWVGLGVVATTVFSGINIIYTYNVAFMAESGVLAINSTLSSSLLPLVTVFYGFSFFARPRKRDKM